MNRLDQPIVNEMVMATLVAKDSGFKTVGIDPDTLLELLECWQAWHAMKVESESIYEGIITDLADEPDEEACI